ncbi:OmpA family protein [Jiulongibacter sp. NS-SX5]|uniref:OmpA family protein n=1 Tax=Jiulongibacter sp. NS-SX5 TaxID=3463854 RepID=UPI0040582890
MKSVLSVLMLLCFQIGTAQITRNPEVSRKSSSDTFINRITITEDYTVVAMQYVSKDQKESLKDYIDSNPELKERLSQMPPMMRNMMLQQMLQQSGGVSTISIQPSSFLQSNDGKKFKFVKATNIPVAPERQEVESDKKYFFRVYFEKLDPGVEVVDLIENENATNGDMTYWNFYGVKVNNPANGSPVAEEDEDVIESKAAGSFILSGKVFDNETDKPIAAKIVCKIKGKSTAFDSLYTSKSGYYEFLLQPENFVYIVSAPGYENYEQALDLKNWSKNIDQDFYLNPTKKVESTDEESKEETVKEVLTEEAIDEEIIEAEELEKVDENTFRLNNVYFFTGKAEISNSSYRELKKLLKLMTDNPEMKIRVDGHTDNQGDPDLNLQLSIDRAKAVRNYLIKEGIKEDRVEIKGWGESKPLTDNSTEVKRQKNRRVEIVILD